MRPRISPALLVSLGVCALIGLIGGGAFGWAEPQRAWNIFIAAFLWALIGAVGTAIGRSSGERLRRGDWGHGARLALGQTFPPMGGFALAAGLVGAPLSADLLGLLGLGTAALALLLLLLLPLSSPYRRGQP